jgi:hypothetical protein
VEKRHNNIKAQFVQQKQKMTAKDYEAKKTLIAKMLREKLDDVKRDEMSKYLENCIYTIPAFVIILTQLRINDSDITVGNLYQNCIRTFGVEGFPLNEKHNKTLIGYVSCVLKQLANTGGEDGVFKGLKQHTLTKIEDAIKKHTNDIFEKKPELKQLIENQAEAFKEMNKILKAHILDDIYKEWGSYRPFTGEYTNNSPFSIIISKLLKAYNGHQQFDDKYSLIEELIHNDADFSKMYKQVAGINKLKEQQKSKIITQPQEPKEDGFLTYVTEIVATNEPKLMKYEDKTKKDTRILNQIVVEAKEKKDTDEYWEALSKDVVDDFDEISDKIGLMNDKYKKIFTDIQSYTITFNSSIDALRVRNIYRSFLTIDIKRLVGKILNRWRLDEGHFNKMKFIPSKERTKLIQIASKDKSLPFIQIVNVENRDKIENILKKHISSYQDDVLTLSSTTEESLKNQVVLYNKLLALLFKDLLGKDDLSKFAVEFIRTVFEDLWNKFDMSGMDADYLKNAHEKLRENKKNSILTQLEKYKDTDIKRAMMDLKKYGVVKWDTLDTIYKEDGPHEEVDADDDDVDVDELEEDIEFKGHENDENNDLEYDDEDDDLVRNEDW